MVGRFFWVEDLLSSILSDLIGFFFCLLYQIDVDKKNEV